MSTWSRLSLLLSSMISRPQYTPLSFNLNSSQVHQGHDEPLTKSSTYTPWSRSRRSCVLITVAICSIILISLWYLSGALHPPNTPSTGSTAYDTDTVDWSRFAYTQYATNVDYLCNSVMLFEILHRLGSKADRLMLYPNTMHYDQTDNKKEAELLLKARDLYNVQLRPVQVMHSDIAEASGADSYTKLLAFNQTEYHRVLSLDSDSTLLQTMDELFTLPSTPVAMPRAYWGSADNRQLSSQVLLVEPSEEFARVNAAIKAAGPNTYDMEIVNDLYSLSCMVLPHRTYDLVTGEYRLKDHTKYLGNPIENWNPERVFAEAKFIHFSDWPVEKPWIKTDPTVLEAEQPQCVEAPGQNPDCRTRDMWLGFYSDFARRRKEVCGMDLL